VISSVAASFSVAGAAQVSNIAQGAAASSANVGPGEGNPGGAGGEANMMGSSGNSNSDDMSRALNDNIGFEEHNSSENNIKRNVAIFILTPDEIKRNLDGLVRSNQYYKGWQMIYATDINDASKQLKNYRQGAQFDNIALVSHGNDGGFKYDVDHKRGISSDQLKQYNNGDENTMNTKDVTAIKSLFSIANNVKAGGTFMLQACTADNGDKRAIFLNNLKQNITSKINIVSNYDVCYRPHYRGYGYSIMGGSKPIWMQIDVNGNFSKRNYLQWSDQFPYLKVQKTPIYK